MASIGPYSITEEIARGGMGAVYRAVDPAAGREVAIKLLLAGPQAAEVQQRRFAREARALAKINHPHVVRVHSVGQHQGSPYLVMDFVAGASLDERLEQGPLPSQEAARITRLLAGALEHAHGLGILHRDLKPSNVLLDGDDPLLTDFGLAKDLDSRSRLTHSGRSMGTPGYWAPEQARGETDAVGVASDVYGLGATLYAMLTGEPPYMGGTLIELLAAMERSAPESPTALRPDVDPRLEAVCLKCLRRDPAERYASAAELEADLDRYLRGDSVEARAPSAADRAGRWVRRQRLPLGIVGGALGIVTLALAVSQGEPPARPVVAPLPVAPPSPATASESRDVGHARTHLKAGRFAEGLEALEAVPEPPAELSWKLVQGLVDQALRMGDALPANVLLRSERIHDALERGDARVQDERLLLSQRLIEHACTLHSEPMAPVAKEVLEQLVAHAQLARWLCPTERAFPAERVQPLMHLVHSRMGIASRDDLDLLYVDLGDACCQLVPELLEGFVKLSIRSLDMEVKEHMLPAVRRLAERTGRLDHRYLLGSSLLNAVGDHDAEAFAVVAELLESEELNEAQVSRLLDQRARKHTALSRYEEALADYQRALELFPLDADLRLKWIEAMILAGHKARGRAEVVKYLDRFNWRVRLGPLDHRNFRFTVTALWNADGGAHEPDLTRDAIQCLLKEGQPERPRLWELRLARMAYEHDQLEEGRRLALRVAEAFGDHAAVDPLRLRLLELARDGGPRGAEAADELLAIEKAFMPFSAKVR